MKTNKRTVFITGVTGVMGMGALNELMTRLDRFNLTLLVRPSEINRKKMARYSSQPGIRIVWGDLTCYDDVLRGAEGADVVLHVGAMVSPQADYRPKATWRVNVGGTENVVRAVLAQSNADSIRMVYIGSVSQTSDRREPIHWGRTGDPICLSALDYYGLSKAVAERVVVESGIRHWVSLRQSAVLYADILKKFDPILYHVPLRGVQEWTTLDDSSRALANVCEEWVADDFWNRFYHIGSGDSYRITNYQFEQRLLRAIGCPSVEQIFNPEWFALRNFHGLWLADSDRLEHYLRFRVNIPLDTYFDQLKKEIPWFYSLARIVPASLIKRYVTRPLAYRKGCGTMDWIRKNDSQLVVAFFGSQAEWRAIPSWETFDKRPPTKTIRYLDHGYDEQKTTDELGIEDVRQAACFRGGRCLSDSMNRGDLATKLRWECAFGHRFEASPALVLLGGHWCPACMPPPWINDEIARKSPFFAQAWLPTHHEEEMNRYDGTIYKIREE